MIVCIKNLLIFFLFSFSSFLSFFKLQNSRVPYNIDEVSWFFHTAFFDELFLKHNLDKKLWLSFESFDHPQLSKYIFGAYLFSKNKEYMHDRDKLLAQYGRWDFYRILGHSSKAILHSPFYTPINIMREINLAVTFLTLIVLFLLCKILTQNIFISVIFVFSLASNSLFTRNMLTAYPDAHYMFFILLALFSYIKYIRSQRKLYLYLFAVFSGLSLTAKFTGAVILVAYVLYLLFRLSRPIRKKMYELGNMLKEFLVVISIAAVIWTATNPAIVYAPVNSSILYFSSRIEKLELFSHLFQDVGLINIRDRIYATYCISFSADCHGYSKGFDGRLFANPFLNILFASFRVLYLIQLLKGGRKSGAIFLMILLIIVFIGSTVFIPLKWARYYLPLVVFLRLLEFMGINYVVNFMIKRYGLKIKQLVSMKMKNSI